MRIGLRAVAASVVLALTTTLMLAVSASPAAAMAQVGSASGYPGDTVTIKVVNEAIGPRFSAWVLTHPAGVTILSASGAAASGAHPFACSVGPSAVQCGPAGAGGWASGNVVTMTAVISASAPAGMVAGTSSIAAETGQFSVAVLAPPAPGIWAPAEGSQTLETTPAISGDKRPGNSALAFVDGVESCGVPADAAASWSCTPAAPLAYGAHSITATQASPANDVSPASAAVAITVLEPAGLSLSHDGAAGAVPTATIEHRVTLRNSGPGVAPNTSVSVDLGGFPASSCTVGGVEQDCATLAASTPVGDLAPGAETVVVISGEIADATPVGTSYQLTAAANSISDAASPVTSGATITVIAPPPPRITAPAEGASTTNVRPAIHGDGALAGATITVSDVRGPVCTATAPAAGSWSCSPASTFALGPVRLVASQVLGGAVSAASPPLSFSVVAPPVPPPVTPGSGGQAPEQEHDPAPVVPPKPLIPPATKPPIAITPPRPPSPTALAMSLRFGSTTIAPGTVGTMRGELGPNATDSAVTITLGGRLSKGMSYRSVSLRPNGECEVSGGVFHCTATLEPGESVSVEIRIYADTLNAPALGRQQLVIDSSLPAQSNAMTSAIRTTQSTEAGNLAAEVSAFPGAFIPLLALFLLALAATETERRRRTPAPATLVTRS